MVCEAAKQSSEIPIFFFCLPLTQTSCRNRHSISDRVFGLPAYACAIHGPLCMTLSTIGMLSLLLLLLLPLSLCVDAGKWDAVYCLSTMYIEYMQSHVAEGSKRMKKRASLHTDTAAAAVCDYNNAYFFSCSLLLSVSLFSSALIPESGRTSKRAIGRRKEKEGIGSSIVGMYAHVGIMYSQPVCTTAAAANP